jgi:hypothetical protein
MEKGAKIFLHGKLKLLFEAIYLPAETKEKWVGIDL